MAGSEGSQGAVVRTEEVHDQGNGGNGTVGQPWLFKHHGWTVVFHQQIGDSSSLVDDVHGPVDADKFTSSFEVVHPTLHRPPCHASS